MQEIKFRSHFTVELEGYMGSDTQIANVARVSTGGNGMSCHPEFTKKDYGLLNMLMRDRHGTPWESGVLQFYIESPIFVNREFFRHRIASYNETSSRYKEMEPVFYIPGETRPLKQVGKPGAYTFEAGNAEQKFHVEHEHGEIARLAWGSYQDLLARGVAREVARNVLPLTLYSSFYVTMNLRSLFNFLSLRRVTKDTSVPTFPLYEIDNVAEQMEDLASQIFPTAIKLFNLHGRRAV